MTAFFVSRIRVKNKDRMQEYAQSTGPTIGAHNGKLVLKGVADSTLLGDDAGEHITSIVEFPSLDHVNTWFNSPEYQVFSDLREQAGEMQFVAYETPAT